ncbi:shikimate kinase [Bombilactobacillus folatiphilus]|uniref:Shikimate kinase n=1 Tax=Bombilactobacillus folatiphilus TaxID=2923362 RepID=A0ABY4P9P4_9LACO|nr:shikimate kinase [Bombilactobacillus folatiphilus]UQS82397.1 shikimate kinase [Bombilactobacillus folatiphilus]
MMDIVLTGFMGSGKTTIGPLLAQELRLPFFDLDVQIVQLTGCSIVELFEDGENYFRQKEQEVLQKVIKQPGVLALGGGTPTRPSNRELLRHSGAQIILLEAQIQTIWQRLQQTQVQRPLVQTKDQLVALKKQRQKNYQQVANLCVQTDNYTPQQVVKQIAEQVLILRGSENYRN